MPRKPSVVQAAQAIELLPLIEHELGLSGLRYISKFERPCIYLMVTVVNVFHRNKPTYYLGCTNGTREYYRGGGKAWLDFVAKTGMAFVLRFVVEDVPNLGLSEKELERELISRETVLLKQFRVESNRRFFNKREEPGFTLEERRRAGQAVQPLLRQTRRALYDPAVRRLGSQASAAKQARQPVPRDREACSRGGKAAQERFRKNGEHFFDSQFQRVNGLKSAESARREKRNRFDPDQQRRRGLRGQVAAKALGKSL